MSSQLQLDLRAALDAKIVALLRSSKLTPVERDLLSALARHAGAANAVSIAELQALLPRRAEGERIPAREVKQMVKDLIELYGVPVGSARGKEHGYFLIVTRDDLEDAVRPLVHEIRSIARRVRALSGSSYAASLLGQISMELDREDSPQGRTGLQPVQKGAA